MNNNTKEGKFAFIYSAKFFSSLNFLISFHFSMMLLRLNGWKNTDKVYYLSAMMPRVALLDREKSQGIHKFSILFLNRRMSINFLLNSPCKIAKWMNEKKNFFLPFVFEWKTRQNERAEESSYSVREINKRQRMRILKKKTLNELIFCWFLSFIKILLEGFLFCYSTGKFWHFMLDS